MDALVKGARAQSDAKVPAAGSQRDAKLAELFVDPAMANQGPAAFFRGMDIESLGEGIKDHWFDKLTPEQKDAAVRHMLSVIAAKTKLLELSDNGGNNDDHFKLITALAVSDAPHAEDYFVEFASKVENADSEKTLRAEFRRCQKAADGRITVGTLLKYAYDAGADLSQLRSWSPPIAPTGSETLVWRAADLNVSFANIPHRRWLYGTYLIRGEITVLAAPGGAGKTALATGIAIEIAAGIAKLGETLWGGIDQKVLYINGEDSRIEIARRLWAFCLEHKISEQDITRLSIAAADDPRVQSMSFLRVSERATVLNEDGFNCLLGALETLRPDLIVLDPLVVFCGGGNMNDNAVMSHVMRRLKAVAVGFDCAMLVVHHTRKGRSTGDDPAEEAERIGGAAAIVNLARRALMPVTMTEAETKAYPGSVLPSERIKYFNSQM